MERLAVVRHPVARLESVYLFHVYRTKWIPASTSFEQWISQLELRSASEYGYLDNHTRRMVDLVPEGCRFFRLEDGLGGLQTWLDEVAGSSWPFHIQHLHRLEPLPGESPPSPVRRTRKSVEMIHRMYRDDYSLFGYDLEPVGYSNQTSQFARAERSDLSTELPDLSHNNVLIYQYLDEPYYRSQVKEASAIGDCARHYLEAGARMKLDPAQAFSTAFYLARSPDVVEGGVNPFVHYLRWGQREGRIPHPSKLPGPPPPESDGEDISLIRQYVDIEYYEQQAPHVAACHLDPVKHYFHYGWQQGLDPSPYFSTSFYLEENADVGRSGLSPFMHYLRWGKSEGRRGYDNDQREASQMEHAVQARLVKAFFDVSFYRSQHKELYTNDADPILHFLSVDWRMGLDPSEGFSTNFYIAYHGDKPFEGGNPLSDYLLSGKRSGHIPFECHPLLSLTTRREERLAEEKTLLQGVFDPEYYIRMNADLYCDGRENDLLDHYLLEGWHQGRDPVSWFFVDYYLKAYPRVRDYLVDPLAHYLIWGCEHGLRPNPRAA